MVHTAEEPNTPIAFDQLPLSPETLTAIEAIGYQYATPVQVGAIPPAIEGRDLMVQSQTGTGKTAAFSLPLIEQLKGSQQIGALALAPTRELARQVMEEASRLSAHSPHFSVTCIYGGVSFDDQVVALKKQPTLVVGTPGRVLDHLRRGTLSLKSLQCFVLDEADEMLSMGFAEDLEDILKFLPQQRQTLFFSATFPANVKRYAKKTLNDPLSLSFLDETSSADDLEHYYMLIPGVARGSHLKNLLLEVKPRSAIIFTNTRRDADKIANLLSRHGLEAHKLSGDMDQKARDRVMNKMKAKQIRFLVATDVAARGIDITQLSHVIHYQLPDNPEVYIHRSGRTGRAGAKGVVFSLASSKDLGVIYALKRFHHLSLVERELPKTSRSKTTHRAKSDQSLTRSPTQKTSKMINKPAPKQSGHLGQRTADSQSKVNAVEKVKSPATARHIPKTEPTSIKTNQPSKPAQPTVSQPAISQNRRRSNRRKAKQIDSALTMVEHTSLEKEVESLDKALTDSSSLFTLLENLDVSEYSALAKAVDRSPDRLELIHSLLKYTNTHSDSLSRSKSSKPKEKKTVPPASDQGSVPSPPKQVHQRSWIKVNLGWRDIEGGHSALKALIAELGGLLLEDILQLKVKEHNSLLLVEKGFEEDLITAINGESFQSKRLIMTYQTHA